MKQWSKKRSRSDEGKEEEGPDQRDGEHPRRKAAQAEEHGAVAPVGQALLEDDAGEALKVGVAELQGDAVGGDAGAEHVRREPRAAREEERGEGDDERGAVAEVAGEEPPVGEGVHDPAEEGGEREAADDEQREEVLQLAPGARGEGVPEGGEGEANEEGFERR